MNCPIGYGKSYCPSCCYSKQGLCDYPFAIGQLGETGKPVSRVQREAREFIALGREFSVRSKAGGRV